MEPSGSIVGGGSPLSRQAAFLPSVWTSSLQPSDIALCCADSAADLSPVMAAHPVVTRAEIPRAVSLGPIQFDELG
jgi:hypothetical protein